MNGHAFVIPVEMYVEDDVYHLMYAEQNLEVTFKDVT